MGRTKAASKSAKTTRKAATAARASSRAGRRDRSKRLLDLVMLLLRARSPVSFREIREQFKGYKTKNAEAGLRAFERDKADLLELGVPIRYVAPDEEDAAEEGGYVVDLNRYRMPQVALTADEVSALVLAASVAGAVPGGSTPKIVDLALKKLAFDVPEPPDTPTEFLPPVSTIIAREPVLLHFPCDTSARARELGDRFSRLEAATRGRKRATLTYRSASTGLTRTREVDPYGLLYRKGTWLLVGYCHLRKEVRSFRLDRIIEVQIAPRPKSPDFVRPPDFDVRAYANRSPWTFRSAAVEEVELEFLPEAADTANEDFGSDAVRSDRGDGSAVVCFSCGNPDFAVAKILQAKGGIRVARGERLQRRLATELAAIRAHYGPGEGGR